MIDMQILYIIYLYLKGKNLVCFADPDAMEAVYRAEGVHPVRTYTGPANFQWFYKKKNLPTPFVFLYVSYKKHANMIKCFGTSR